VHRTAISRYNSLLASFDRYFRVPRP
jgi:hypothetical protein